MLDIEDDIPPTEEALLSFYKLKEQISLLGSSELIPIMESPGDGDIYCEWYKPEKRVIIMISPKGRVFVDRITIQDGIVKNTGSWVNPSDQIISDVLTWFILEEEHV